MKKLFILFVFLGVAALLIWLAWFYPVKAPEEEQKPAAEVLVHTAKVTRATLRNYVVAYGNVEAEPTAASRIAPSIPGVVAAVHCVEGQHVRKGDLLIELDSRAAEVAVQFAEKTFERQKKLLQSESSSQKLLQESEQQLSAARVQLSLLQIHAPIAGVITKVNVTAGEAADLSTVLAELVDFERLMVNFNVASGDLTAIKVGQPVEVSTSDSTNAVNSSVTFSSPQLDPKTDSGVARAGLPASSGLRPGQFVRVRVVTAERKDCLVVPLASVAKDPAGETFIALVEDNKAVLKPVKTGLREGDWVEVEGAGIELDKTVVTEGAYGLIMTQQFATTVRVVNE